MLVFCTANATNKKLKVVPGGGMTIYIYTQRDNIYNIYIYMYE